MFPGSEGCAELGIASHSEKIACWSIQVDLCVLYVCDRSERDRSDACLGRLTMHTSSLHSSLDSWTAFDDEGTPQKMDTYSWIVDVDMVCTRGTVGTVGTTILQGRLKRDEAET